MILDFPFEYKLSDGTKVVVVKANDNLYDFHLTRLNSSKFNFSWNESTGEVASSYSVDINSGTLQQEKDEALATFWQLNK